MMRAMNLDAVRGGFVDPVLESQAVFCAALHALSRPGEIVELDRASGLPAPLHAAAGALLLALLDPDTRLWLSPSAAHEPAGSSLRFHTGCPLVEQTDRADFALVGSVHELPALESFALGTDDYPERSTTVLIEVESLEGGAGWRLYGPGIEQHASLAPRGLGPEFVRERGALQRCFPRGIDILFTSGRRLAGLPRSTRVEA